jgi:uncharacterized protein
MIRKCTEADRAQILQLISKKPAENLFMISDIETYGFNHEIQTVWGQFEQDELIAVLLLFSGNYIIYSETVYDAKGFSEIIRATEGDFELSGIQEIVTRIRTYINFPTKRDVETYYTKCEALAYSIEDKSYHEIEQLEAHDYEAYIEMMQSIPEFQAAAFSIERLQRAKRDGTGRTYIIKNEDGLIISAATSNAENSMAAMIVGVGTRPGYEKQGYATKIVEKLTSDLLQENKTVCLFYSNPAAGRIYKRIGFQDIGMWSLIRYNQTLIPNGVQNK